MLVSHFNGGVPASRPPLLARVAVTELRCYNHEANLAIDIGARKNKI